MLRLGVDVGVAVDLAGGGLEDLGLQALGQPQPIDGPVDAGLGGLHGVELVVDGGGGAGQREGDVVAQELEVGVGEQVRDVVLGAGEEVVHADDVVPVGEQALAEVGAEEAGAAGDEDAFAEEVGHGGGFRFWAFSVGCHAFVIA